VKIVEEHNGFRMNQLVIEQKQLSRIVYIEVDDDISVKYERDVHYVRLAHINQNGIETGNSTTETSQLTKIGSITASPILSDTILILTLTGRYRDGGSQSYKGSDGKNYWRSFSIGDKNTNKYGKLFVGNINDKIRVLAEGTFILSDGGEITQ